MNKIQEIIVVEGKDDTVAIRRAVEADTIETVGSAIPSQVIEQIQLAQQTRGVIILTDPDYPGQRIRQIINERVPGCKNAFIPKHQAIEKRGKGVGVEHASKEAIIEALKDARLMDEQAPSAIPFDDLIQAGLIAGDNAKKRRKRLGQLLKIGYANGKQFHKRLRMFRISEDQFREAYSVMLQEEEHE